MKLNAEGQLFLQLELQRAEAHQIAQRQLLIAHANAREEGPFYLAFLEYERDYRLASHMKLLLYENREGQ